MAKIIQQHFEKAAHLFWYVFPDNIPTKIKEGDIPQPPFKRFETKSECFSYLMTNIEGYCCGAKSIKDDGCPQRFNCHLYSNFHKLAGTGKFKGIYMGDIFRHAPYGEDKNKNFVCNSFKSREDA